MIRVVIADGWAIVREGIKRIFTGTGDIQVTGEAENALGTVRVAAGSYWDVMILDPAMAGRGAGLDLLKELRRECPRRPVLVMSGQPEDPYAVHALRAGASGYLHKQCTPEELVRAVRRVCAGGKYISLALAEIMAERLEDPDVRPPHQILSQREMEVLVSMASGKNSTEIAFGMRLSVKTVSTYRTRILRKLQLKGNAELVRYAIGMPSGTG